MCPLLPAKMSFYEVAVESTQLTKGERGGVYITFGHRIYIMETFMAPLGEQARPLAER